MNEKVNATMYDVVPVVSELNKVPGFNPLKFLRQTADGPKLDLKIKKLWFRLKYPAGRTKLTALRITDQLAIIEAKVYFDKNDSSPNGNVVAQAKAQDIPGGLYIEAAQHDALDQALEDAGFGIQFVPASSNNVPVKMPAAVPKQDTEQVVAQTPVQNIAVEQAETVVQSVSFEPAAPLQAETPQIAVETPASEPVEQAPVLHEIVPPAPSTMNVAAAATEGSDNTPGAAPVHEETVAPAAEVISDQDAPAAYTPDMTVEEICERMTREEAGNIIVPVGTCKGMMLSQVADRRPASLKWYLNGYNGDDNILRAGAKMMLDAISAMEKAS